MLDGIDDLQKRKENRVVEKLKELKKKGKFALALKLVFDAYNAGFYKFEIINLGIECMPHLKDISTQILFLIEVVQRQEYTTLQRSTVLSYLIHLLFSLGKLEQADEVLKKIKEMDPNAKIIKITQPATLVARPTNLEEQVTQEEESVILEEEPVVQVEKPVEQEEPLVQVEKPVAQEEEPVILEEEPIVQVEKPVAQEEEPLVQIEKTVVQGEESVVQSTQESNNIIEHDFTKTRYASLITRRLVPPEILGALLIECNNDYDKIDEYILDTLKISKLDLGESLSIYYGTEFVPFNAIHESPFHLITSKNLEANFLKEHGWVPFILEGTKLIALVIDPFNLNILDEIRFIYETNNIELRVTLHNDLNLFIDHFFSRMNFTDESSSLMEANMEADEAFLEGSTVMNDSVVAEAGGDGTNIIRMVNNLLLEAWRQNASDVHIEPNPRSGYCLIRLRVDGSCVVYKTIRIELARPLISRIKIMAQLDIAERRLPQDGKIKFRIPKTQAVVEYRIATIPTIDDQEDVVMRVLASGTPLPMEKLGMSARDLAPFQQVLYRPHGLILVVGPTGSGKTTTLHAAVSYINTPNRKIWTAEDPVEITQTGLRQVQIQPKIGLTFARAMRSFLRADPDVILIGEMRDQETANIGVEASLTGHLVFSTLHTNSAPETITRLLDMDLDPFNFSDSLQCVLAQRLVKTLCPACKEEYQPTNEEYNAIIKEFGAGADEHLLPLLANSPTLFRAKGCPNCAEGYKGRLGIYEFMQNTETLKILIRKKRPTEELTKQAVLDGMLSLKQDGLLKILKGVTDLTQVKVVAGSKD